jgi:hypothetical protein
MKNFFILISLIFSLLFSQNTGYSDSFIDIGTSSRSLGLGQAVVALPANIGGFSINASSTANINQNMFNALYINQFDMAEYYSLGINYPLKNDIKIGFYGLNFFVNNIFKRPDIYNISNIVVRRDSIRALYEQGYSSFRTRETAIFFNISKNYNKVLINKLNNRKFLLNIPIGINIKLIQKDLYDVKGRGIGIDIGGMVNIDFGNLMGVKWIDKMALGIALNNIVNTAIYWDSDRKDYIPMQLVVGVGYIHKIKRMPIKYNLLWQKNSLYINENQFGAELIAFDVISLRVGYSLSYLQGGLGLKFNIKNYSIGLDYSFSDHDLGDAHRIGGWVSF